MTTMRRDEALNPQTPLRRESSAAIFGESRLVVRPGDTKFLRSKTHHPKRGSLIAFIRKSKMISSEQYDSLATGLVMLWRYRCGRHRGSQLRLVAV